MFVETKQGDLVKELGLFLLNRKVENCTRATLQSYEKRISQFLNLTQKSPRDISKNDIEFFLLCLREKNLSPFYIESCFRAIRAFFNWLVAEEIIFQSPMRNMKRPKTPRLIGKEFLSEINFKKLLNTCNSSDYQGARNRAWLMLLWTTGARFSELANLKLKDLDWTQGRIRVLGKGNKERFVPFIKDAQRAIYKYLASRADDYPCLWLADRRRPMTADGLVSVTRRLFERTGIKIKDLHHIFRRTWAYRNLKNGTPIKFVQLCGGWESVTTLEGYIKAMNSEEALNGKGVKWC